MSISLLVKLNAPWLFRGELLLNLSLACCCIALIARVLKFRHGIHAVGNLPGYYTAFQPYAFPGALLPNSQWNMGRDFLWEKKLTLYKNFPNETFSIVPFFLGSPSICTANFSVMRQVLYGDQKMNFQKPDFSRPLKKWGMNLVAAPNGEVWRRHKRIVAPAFGVGLYELVWAETLNTYRQMEDAEGWIKKDTVGIPVLQKLLAKAALLMIAKCAFGFSFNWADPLGTSPSGEMSLQEAYRTISESFILAFLLPDWVRALPLPGIAHVRKAVDQVNTFIRREVENRKSEVRSGLDSEDRKGDVFTMLVRANEKEEAKLRLDAQEVIGNVFVLLFAGHETTARSLTATLALLSLHPDIQDELFEQIILVIGLDRDPAFKDYEKLNKVLSAFYEALRLFPSADLTFREATEDVVLQLPNTVGQGTTPLAIQKGTIVIIDVIGAHRNLHIFEDPESFKPSRWYDSSDQPELMAFGAGIRACIGRKFAATEAVAFLTMFLRDWRVEPMYRDGETQNTWKERVLGHTKMTVGMGLGDVPLRFVRRAHV